MPREQELALGGRYSPRSPAIATDIEECFTFLVCNAMHFPQLDLFIFAVKAYAPCVTKNMTEGAQVKQ